MEVMIQPFAETEVAVAAEIISTAEITAVPWELERQVRDRTVASATQMVFRMV
jgi:hypothetical protein